MLLRPLAGLLSLPRLLLAFALELIGLLLRLRFLLLLCVARLLAQALALPLSRLLLLARLLVARPLLLHRLRLALRRDGSVRTRRLDRRPGGPGLGSRRLVDLQVGSLAPLDHAHRQAFCGCRDARSLAFVPDHLLREGRRPIDDDGFARKDLRRRP